MGLRVFSDGGGVQSTAALVLAAAGRIDYPVFLFANVGDDSENRDTITYVRNVQRPFAEAHGIELHEIRRRMRDGSTPTLLEHITKPSRSIDIPLRMANGAPGNRNCSETFKIKVVAKWAREHGATPEAPATVGIGISRDEWKRSRTSSGFEYMVREEPLLDLNVSRGDCHKLIADAGLPQPPKSACWFCPYKRPLTWQEMKRDDPERFAAAVELERLLNVRRRELGKDDAYLTRFGVPLDRAMGDHIQEALFDDEDECATGVCFT